MDGGAVAMTFDEAWPILQEEAINKLIDSLQLEGPLNHQIFTSQDYMRLYTVVYTVTSPNAFSPEVDKLYGQYKRTFEDYSSTKVLPALRGKENNNLLKELLRRWNNHKTMLFWLSRFFNYLSRHYIPKKGLPSLVETSHSIFYNKVFGEIINQVRDAVTSLIEMDREGEQTNQALAKQVLSIFEEIGGDALKNFEKDIEEAMVEASASLYSGKALGWITTMSYENYMLKVVQHELLNVHARKLEEKRTSS